MNKTFLLLAITWFATISVLFFLPGSAFQTDHWMARIWLDKWIHLGFFAVLVWLWARGLGISGRKSMTGLAIAAVLYGLIVEVIQHQFVVNRSFDLFDLVADAAGIGVGAIMARMRGFRGRERRMQ
jgi:VanZ family protein